VSAARRARMSEDRLDEVRLVTGELCTRAVLRTRQTGTRAPVEVRMIAHPDRYEITVIDVGNAAEETPAQAALDVAAGSADAVEITDGPAGTGGTVRATWLYDDGPR
jgi:anti-sigma regulatory factor (Ser/Thr protein kinase)